MILKVRVHPNSDGEKIEKKSDNDFEIWVKEEAEDNKANNRVVNLLSKEIGVDWRKMKIKNPKSREKIIEVK